MEKIAHYCQKCRHANRVGERHCRRCGTRLMIVVFPPSMRRDEGVAPSFYEDHLLERVSLLELQLAQAVEKIGMISSFFAREAKEIKKEQKFIRAFAERLEKENPRLAEEFNRLRGEKTVERSAGSAAADRKTKNRNEIIAAHANPNRELFAHLVKEGVRLLGAREEKQAFQMLERAVLLSPENVALLVFTAEQLYRADQFERSKTYLERAFDFEPDNATALLLLGAICADAGDVENGRKFLSVLASNEDTFELIHFAWGVMAAFEANWTEALAAFKFALGDENTPELSYLIGCVYFQLANYESALAFFEKTAAADEKYADTHFMKSVIYKLAGDRAAEDKELETAANIKESGAQCAEYLSGKKQFDLPNALPFLHFQRPRKQLLTGGAPRLHKFFRRRILEAVG